MIETTKLKKENEALKKELKQLNDQLNKILERVQAKPRPEEEQKGTDARLEVARKELENEVRKNGMLKK
jgi:predicted RNase H-like nuclease (RuvC/YqgF family)